MAKRYFSKKKKYDTTLNKIILVLVLILGLAYVMTRWPDWFGNELLGEAAEASAADSLEKARRQLDGGDVEGAQTALMPLLARASDPVITPQAMMLQAQIELSRGATDEALGLLEKVTTRYPEHPKYPVAAARYARLLEEKGEVERAVTIYEQVRETAPPELRAAALVGLGRAAERSNDLVAARDLFDQASKEAEWGADDWEEALEHLGKLNAALIFSASETPESKKYTVESGDNLTSIGIKLNTTQGLLVRANNITDPARLHPGDTLKYTPKDFRIIIERSTCRLYLLDTKGLFKRYPVCLGKAGYETTLGSYTIGNKEKDPKYFVQGQEPIPAGDPRNELGSRWMPLVPTEAGLPIDLGIHGTIAPESIGHYESKGCARMFPADVEELYDLVVRSTPVEIVETVDPKILG